MEDVKVVRNYYNVKLEGFMFLYGLKNEGEVIIGCLFRVNIWFLVKIDEKFEVV